MIPIFNLKTIREKITYSYFSPPMPQPKKQGFWKAISDIHEERELEEQIFELRNCIIFPITFPIRNFDDTPSIDENSVYLYEEYYSLTSTPSEIFKIEGTIGRYFDTDTLDSFIATKLYLDKSFIASVNPQKESIQWSDQQRWTEIGTIFGDMPAIRDGNDTEYFFINLTKYDKFLKLNEIGKNLVSFLLGENPKYINPEASGEWEVIE